MSFLQLPTMTVLSDVLTHVVSPHEKGLASKISPASSSPFPHPSHARTEAVSPTVTHINTTTVNVTWAGYPVTNTSVTTRKLLAVSLGQSHSTTSTTHTPTHESGRKA